MGPSAPWMAQQSYMDVFMRVTDGFPRPGLPRTIQGRINDGRPSAPKPKSENAD
ncbi:hypothetical protein HBA55_13500 [Pseudomaricurvus alkylphenolicus]|uniref:hypothetical protein n=1 Tax=Pseudomaricurvus alkylphenolicus TaxID=1306991 RepID=UPI00141EEABD|nr:hypothetical protein [Pseudomaricurvus alkylphenolicus]NIB40611.1 hypothetical protein [Pseudomaricurvus alkylphenolicus]